MKLWYQSMSRQAEWGSYPRVLRGILDRARDPDTEIHVAGITEIGGVGLETLHLRAAATRSDRRVPQALRCRHLSDAEGTMTGSIPVPSPVARERRHWPGVRRPSPAQRGREGRGSRS
jgi:hypothetical protein